MRPAPAIAAAFLATTLACGTAGAGDYAQRDILGFSPDGSTFAFEEYGIQDGSGFPYSNIYVIDTARDAWVAGTPIRVRRDDETVALLSVRDDARKQAGAVLKTHGIVPVGDTLVSNPVTEVGADPYAVRFITNPYVHTDRIWTVTLTPLPFPDPPGCENLGPVHGLRLVLGHPDGTTEVLQEDARLPSSRGCAQDYAISDVLAYFPDGGKPVLAILLSLYTVGFEGPDRRFLAVTAPFSE